MIKTYRARRRLKMLPDVWREPDELVPEAHTWFRVDSWLHTGYMTEAEVTEDEFLAAIERFCPELLQQLSELVGLDGSVLTGPRQMPKKVAQPRVQRVKKTPAPTAS